MSMNMNDLPKEAIYERIIYPSVRNGLWKKQRIVFLKSETGKQYNNMTCTVIGYDEDYKDARSHCRIEGNGQEPPKTIRVKYSNLIPLQDAIGLDGFLSQSKPLSDVEVKERLHRSLTKHGSRNERNDVKHRLQLYNSLLQKLHEGEDLTDDDYIFPCGAGLDLLPEGKNFTLTMKMTKPGCYGNNTFDVRYTDLGLKGDGQEVCSICTDVLKERDDDGTTSSPSSEDILVTLPCFHIFHEPCIKQWLGSSIGMSSWSCPTCRQDVPYDMSTYCVRYDEQLQSRFDEFPMTGFCTKCQMGVMEKRRNDPMPVRVRPASNT